jgi:hypothetical protein
MSLIWVAVPLLVVEIAVIVAATRPARRIAQQHEGDIRLPYKRYRKLYPNTSMSYEDYKKMQARDSYRHAISSKTLKRMVH